MRHMANRFPTCRALGLSLCLFGFHYLGAQSTEPSYALRGTLVTPGGIVENGTVLIQQSKIVAAGAKVKAAGECNCYRYPWRDCARVHRPA